VRGEASQRAGQGRGGDGKGERVWEFIMVSVVVLMLMHVDVVVVRDGHGHEDDSEGSCDVEVRKQVADRGGVDLQYIGEKPIPKKNMRKIPVTDILVARHTDYYYYYYYYYDY
jgi:hypothetical protein